MTILKKSIEELKGIANDIRKDIVTMVYKAQSGHPGGSLSCADIMAALYFYKLNVDPKNPKWEDRDRFVLSKGHACPALFPALVMRGFVDDDCLKNFRSVKSQYPSTPSTCMPGVDMSSGPLGQGLSVAVGMALAARVQGKSYKTYCVMGDGETQEGQVWEALMTGAKYQLGNLICILDNNKIQMCGTNEEIMPLGDICKKYESFGWRVIHIDGHDMQQIVDALDSVDDKPVGAPTMIVAETVKGKGVSFMEGTAAWHGKAPNDEQYAQAMKELGGEKE